LVQLANHIDAITVILPEESEFDRQVMEPFAEWHFAPNAFSGQSRGLCKLRPCNVGWSR
jgi:hypothetical protein